MTRGLIRKATLIQNAFPGEHGVSDTLSPRNIIDNLPNLDYHSIKIPFGAYAQVAVDEEITNTLRPRTIGCIVLDPVGVNRKYRFMSLETGRRISGRLVKVLPITEEVIARVNHIASEQQQSTIHNGELLFEWRPGRPLDNDEAEYGLWSDGDLAVEHDQDMIPEPVANDIDDNIFAERDGEDSAHEITEDDQDHDIEEGSHHIRTEDDDTNDNDEVSEDEDSDEDDVSYDAGSGGAMSNGDADLSFDDDNDLPEERQIVGSENDSSSSHSFTGPEISYDDVLRDNDEQLLGRGMRERVPNPKYYGDDYTNFQFLQHAFEDLDGPSMEDYREYAVEQYVLSGKTHLIERYLAGIVLTQMTGATGLKKHGKEGEKVLLKEFMQFKNMDVMEAVNPDELTSEQKRNALGMVSVMQEKRDHTPEKPNLRYRACANGSTQKGKYLKEETTSPALSPDSNLLTLMTDAMEGRDVAIADVVGAYLNATMDEFVAMRVVGREAELMCELNPEWKQYLRADRKGRSILYVVLKKALYGCVKSALLWYNLYRETLEDLGFVVNPYDQCVANATINGNTCTICWYVDDNKISHVDPAVVTDIISKIENKFGKMKVSRGNEHDFLGMKIKFHENKTVSIDMKSYVKGAIDEFPEDIIKNASTPATRYLFETRDDSVRLDHDKTEIFHSTVAKLLYICKRCRLDIQNAVAFLTTRVSKPDEDDWKKLKRVLQYLRGTIDDKLVLGCVDIGKMKSFVDASFAVHMDMKSHTGGGISWGIGILLSMCQKQRLNAKSSTEAEVIGVSDFLSGMIWARMFLEKQGYTIDENILYQDNQSAIKIEENGSKSCSKRSRHIDMRYFFIKDRLKSENINVVYCPTECMVADFFTKPLQGKLFHYLKAIVMGHKSLESLIAQFNAKNQERVVENPKSDVSTDVIPCIKTELKYSDNIGRTETKRETNDVGKSVSFQPLIPKHMKSYAEAVKTESNELRAMGKKYPLIDFYPKVKT
jgi:hypothetical protein